MTGGIFVIFGGGCSCIAYCSLCCCWEICGGFCIPWGGIILTECWCGGAWAWTACWTRFVASCWAFISDSYWLILLASGIDVTRRSTSYSSIAEMTSATFGLYRCRISSSLSWMTTHNLHSYGYRWYRNCPDRTPHMKAWGYRTPAMSFQEKTRLICRDTADRSPLLLIGVR